MVVIKVTNVERTKKVGVVARNLEEFHHKVMTKYKLTDKQLMKDVTYHLTSDGVLIDCDEYFQTLEPQTSVMMVLKEQKDYIKTDFEFLMENIRVWQKDYLNAGKSVELFIKQNNDKIFSEIFAALKSSKLVPHHERIGISDKYLKHDCIEDKLWFEGLETNAKTKELYMFKKAQDRIRSYFYKTKDDLYHSTEYRENKLAKSEIDFLINNFKKWLIHYGFFGHIFDRTKYTQINKLDETNADDNILKAKKLKLMKDDNNLTVLEKSLAIFPLKKTAVCDSFGKFSCQGAWNKVCCVYGDHVINPYISREYRILFQTWNLDHQVEKSRTVIPNILKNVKYLIDDRATCLVHPDRPAVHLTQVIYFLELFTMANLKLVHIVCHDKKAHELQSSGGCLCTECHDQEQKKMSF
ncbi:DNA fragmentation factor subunit beta-like [Ctenocephalides felis]|uniref:DNA fragmentation factor subunit beta-like n=1 Tax=Ctenocephalides felis TaxID=7515 RepID=UPI000E6E26A0|nr:DNA fragmentation factor subunit beta-like [Ctenocephalides felis]